MQDILMSILFALYSLTIVGVILVIITDNRNPLKTVPWILVLVLAPGVGLIFYFFFGQNLSKQHILSRKMRRSITAQIEGQTYPSEVVYPESHRPLISLINNTNHSPLWYGSRLTPYVDGRVKMEALLDAIEHAQHHIHLQYYILSDDCTGCRLKDALCRKAEKGVHIRVLYDDMGSRGIKREFFDQMREKGIEVYSFLHVRFPLLTSKVNYRNHRKIVVIDGRVGFMGGMNIADRYVKGVEWGTWRDTHFKVEGSAVLGLQVSFLSDWSATTKQNVRGEEYFPKPVNYTQSFMQVVTGGPLGKWRVLLKADSYAISRAKRRVWIQTPYYLPSEVLNSALQSAALAGVDVRLMLPARSDVASVNLASHSFLDSMIRSGVKIYFYQKGFLHSKLLIVDDDLSIIGSANMDFRSFEHNFEVNGYVYDRQFTKEIAEIYERDMAVSEKVVPAKWFARPLLHRFAESFMRMFAPLM